MTEENLATQLTDLLGNQDLQTRIQRHLAESKSKERDRSVAEAYARAAASEELEFDDATDAPPYEPPPKDAPKHPYATFSKMVYLAYSYTGIPSYAKPLKEDLQKKGYLVFNPLLSVEDQFDEEHKSSLFGLDTKVPASVCRFLKMSEALLKPLGDETVVEMLRRGDARGEVDSMIFKELYFLVRSSVVICDLITEPYGCELYQKLFYAKIFDIPVIGVAPLGRSVSAYAQKYLKVLLVDEFNSDNILPLVSAYAPLRD